MVTLETRNLILLCGEDLESAIGFHSVFAYVEAPEFFLLADAYSDCCLERAEDRKGRQQACGCNGCDAQSLPEETVLAAEKPYCEGAPYAAHQVNRQCTDGIVQAQLVEDQDRANDQDAGKQADKDRCPSPREYGRSVAEYTLEQMRHHRRHRPRHRRRGPPPEVPCALQSHKH